MICGNMMNYGNTGNTKVPGPLLILLCNSGILPILQLLALLDGRCEIKDVPNVTSVVRTLQALPNLLRGWNSNIYHQNGAHIW